MRSRWVGRVQQGVENAPHLSVRWLSPFLPSPGSGVAGTVTGASRTRCPARPRPALRLLGAAAVRRAGLVPAARARVGRAPGWRSFAPRCPPRIPLLWAPSNRRLQPRPRHGECAIRCEALPQLPAASPGASVDRGFSGRGARPRAGTTSRPRVSPPSCTLPSVRPLPVSQLCTPGPFLQPSVVLGLTL